MPAKYTPSWGRTARERARWPRCWRAAISTTSPRAKSSTTGRNLLDLSPEDRARAGIFLAFQYPVEIPGRQQHVLPESRPEHRAQGTRPGRAGRHGFPGPGQGKAQDHGHRPDAAEPPGEHRIFGRREKAQRDLSNGRAGAQAGHAGRNRFGPGYRRAAHRGRRRQRVARPASAP